MPSSQCILRVAIPAPLRRWFDYLPPENIDTRCLKPGQRLLVPFGKNKKRIGLLLEIADASELPIQRLKKVCELIDVSPIYTDKHLKFLRWASEYYQYPVGEVVFSTMPALLRAGRPVTLVKEQRWRIKTSDLSIPGNATKQKAILAFLMNNPEGVSRELLNDNFINWQMPLNKLTDKKLVETFYIDQQKDTYQVHDSLMLSKAQKDAVTTIKKSWDEYQTYLLNGVTGSGKTEIYLHCIEHAIRNNQQSIILLPEIGLTPQFIQRIKARFEVTIALMHSGLSDKERLNAWIQARDGNAKIIIGTRSAVWIPLKKPGLIIVDEEHDLSFKQQDGFRYSARDMAIIRAQDENIPVILGSATPSMESLRNVSTNRFIELILPKRAGNASLPEVRLLDIRGNDMVGAFSRHLLDKIADCLTKKQQVLLFHNRRGFAPVMMCHSCGYVMQCPRCDVQLTFHKQKNKLCCHHCGHESPMEKKCPECQGNKIIEIGFGTERLVETLNNYFPDVSILRVDRDTTRRRNSMHTMLEKIQDGSAKILVGTQMLAKGHHFPNVTLVGIVDADHGLFNIDYRASERMAQLITQVCGRAGRADHPGAVVIQTHHPGHPLLSMLVKGNYDQFAQTVLLERKQAELPPYSYHALLRAEANESSLANKFLYEAKSSIPEIKNNDFKLFGPLPAPIEKRAGRYRLQLLIQASKRNTLRQILGPWMLRLEQLKSSKKVRWSLDVDPQETV